MTTSTDIKSGYVYAIYDSIDESYKLGFSKDVDRRLREEQTSNPHTLIIQYRLSVKNMRKAEAAIHTLFAGQRIRGEWFKLDEQAHILFRKVFNEYEITEREYKQLESLHLR